LKKFFRLILISAGLLTLAGGISGTVLIGTLMSDLPSIESIRNIRLKVPLEVYTIDGRLIAQFGNHKRIPLTIDHVPKTLINAITAAEDDRFFHHHGIDITGVARALIANIRSGDISQGASTITMQVARNYFLSREKTYIRKVKEILLAIKIEQKLSKEEILELYINKIFLGHRAYGFAAAAAIYYDKPLEQLSLDQLAVLAGLPKAPSRNNPVTNPVRAQKRRNYVLYRMYTLGHIDRETYQSTIKKPVVASKSFLVTEVDAHHIAEMVRSSLVSEFGQAAYTDGYRVYTSVDSTHQAAANRALRHGLLAYDRRHGYRGPANNLDTSRLVDSSYVATALANANAPAPLIPAVVLNVAPDAVSLALGDDKKVVLGPGSWRWTKKSIDVVVNPGDLIYVIHGLDGLLLAQLPEIDGALVSLNPHDGAVLALVGGFDFARNKLNHVTQALRQPGSNIKPFIYSAALDNGFSAASMVSAAPIVIEDTLGNTWKPQNYNKKFFGPTRLRRALSLSLNLVSVRITRSLGIPLVTDHLERFGFSRERLSTGLSLALGSASTTPMEIARGYAVFANGGYLIEPYFIARIENRDGRIVRYANHTILCPTCRPDQSPSAQIGSGITRDLRYARRAISPENAYLMTSLMNEVMTTGTGRKSLSLGRTDLSGKTGTTNNFRDAWFTGFNHDITASVWVGFDQPKELGRRESGSRAALPIWIDYMTTALKDKPIHSATIPENIVMARINRHSGQVTDPTDPDGIDEYFVMGSEPHAQLSVGTPTTPKSRNDTESNVEKLF
jgi:penicillin-binding protein 1A